VNLPNDATVDEIAEIYHQGWKLGLKAVALYRDGCKASQPLSTTSDKKKDDKAEAKAEEPVVEVVKAEPAPVAKVEARMVAAAPSAAVATGSESGAEFGPLFSKSPALGPQRAFRYRLPKKRRGFTQEARIGGHKVFLRTGEYEDGQLGEIFIDMHKEGAAFRSMMNAFAIAVSMGLQHGVPLAEFVDQFTFTRFEPQGAVSGHANVKFATSIIDYVFRVLGIEYQRRYDLAHVPPEEAAATTTDAPVNNAPAMSQAPAGALFATTTGGDSEGGSALDKHLGKMMGDAPFCDNCGHITVRNGACYRCLNCGSSMGCS
jgi:ribonucleoside-diphosphate reductase alpha chain